MGRYEPMFGFRECRNLSEYGRALQVADLGPTWRLKCQVLRDSERFWTKCRLAVSCSCEGANDSERL